MNAWQVLSLFVASIAMMALVVEIYKYKIYAYARYYAICAVIFLFLIAWLSLTIPMWHVFPRLMCDGNITQSGRGLIMYAKEHADKFPELSRSPGNLFFDYANDIKDFFQDSSMFYSSGEESNSKTRLGDPCRSFLYLGYAVRDEQELLGLCVFLHNVWWNSFATVEQTEKDCAGIQDLDLNVLPEEMRITPLLIERPSPDSKECDVFFLDGHTEFIPVGSRWPLSKEAISLLAYLDGCHN
jgi:hypothetical protein